MDRLHNRCLALSLALLLTPFSGCGNRATETTVPQASERQDQGASDRVSQGPRKKSRKELPPTTLMVPDLKPALEPTPVVDTDTTQSTKPVVLPVESSSQAPIFRLPCDAVRDDSAPTSDYGLKIEVSEAIMHIGRLPAASEHALPVRTPQHPVGVPQQDAPAAEDVALEPSGTPGNRRSHIRGAGKGAFALDDRG